MSLPRRNPKGFTLIEVSVAMAITISITTVIVSVTSLSLDTWNRSRSEVRACRQAKSMTDSMARDFEALVIRKGNPFQWLSAEATTPTSGPNGQQSPNAARLVFFSAATDRYNGQASSSTSSNGGNVSTIAYDLHYKAPIGNDQADEFSTFVLYRKIVNPDLTFNDLLCKTSLTESFDAYSNSVGDGENFICENVYQFTVTFHLEITIPDGFGTRTQHVPIQVGQNGLASAVTRFEVFGNKIVIPNGGSSTVTATQLATSKISAVEVSLTILTDYGLQQMRKRTFSSAADKSDFLGKNSYQYSKLIPITCT
jgi:prepilin-type N-terminal cleavage/methylation domain-containing protein